MRADESSATTSSWFTSYPYTRAIHFFWLIVAGRARLRTSGRFVGDTVRHWVDGRTGGQTRHTPALKGGNHVLTTLTTLTSSTALNMQQGKSESSQRLPQIFYQVAGVLEPDREPQEVVRCRRLGPLDRFSVLHQAFDAA